MYKAFKFRMYPTDEQKVLISKNFGGSRFVYNYYLSYIKEHKYLNANVCINHYVNHLKQEYPFLTEADSIIIRNTLFINQYFDTCVKIPRGFKYYDRP